MTSRRDFYLRTDALTNTAPQREALRYTDAHGDNPEELRGTSVVHRVRCRPSVRRLRDGAVTLAESAQQGAPYLPGGSVSTTLGAAYYRVGRYTEALGWLQDGLRLRPRFSTVDPVNVAFIAMAHQRLGQTEEARRQLERLESILAASREIGFRIRSEAIALAAEADSVVRGPPPK